jgi:hypothetical protein
MFICYSGAFGGNHCGLRVSTIDNSFTSLSGVTDAVAQAVRIGRIRVIDLIHGDSGGSVYSLAGPTAVVAAGTIIGIQSNCPAGITFGPLCTQSLDFSDMTVLTYLNVSMMTQ